jgi:hypothetical protein
MLAKCLWKRYNRPPSQGIGQIEARKVDMEHILSVLIRCVRLVPKRKDSRRDPILEPHYKLAAIIHKLVHAKALRVSQLDRTLVDSSLTFSAG